VRADRLVAVLLLLQRRDAVTAAEVAAELEVSERTARRDLEALGMAGLPVYAARGRNGGWRLAGGGRTDLSGLTEAEVRTLFLLAGPSSPATPELRAAPARPDPPHLDAVQQAVVEGRQAVLEYVAGTGEATHRLVHPLGLAVKGTVWYLVADTERGRRTFRVDRIRALELTDDPVVVPDRFDLSEAWRSVTAAMDERRTQARARALVDPGTVGLLRWVLGPRLGIGPAGVDGRVEVELRGADLRALAGEIAGFGGAIEVLEPEEVRALLGGIGRELADHYR